MYRLISILLVFVVLQGCDFKPTPEKALQQKGVTFFKKAITPSAFKFKNKEGEWVDNSVFLGKWNLVFFGYTYCPDVCPTALMNMRRLFEMLDENQRQRFQVVFVSVDPERDTPELLKPFLGYFNPDFKALTGNKAALKNLSSQMHAFYAKVKTTGEAPYLMDHSANITLVDPEGDYRGFITPPHNPEKIKDILAELDKL